ncbi:MAG: uroporphyrinogen-III C-methyltransferase [Thiotrichales bacterium]|nr:uroporphyrinogen-III C-methyltransferase [Thiotrichales bacterium]
MTGSTANKDSKKQPATGRSLVRIPALSDPTRKKIIIASCAVLAILLVLVLIRFSALNASVTEAGQRHEESSQNLIALERNMRTLQQEVKDMSLQSASLATEQNDLAEKVRGIQRSQPLDTQSWGLREVEYLILIAMHRLQLEHDVQTAISALSFADQRLQDLANPSLTPLRESLTTDINSLQAIGQVDITGTAAILADLTGRVETLPVKTFLEDSHTTADDAVPDANVTATNGRSWAELPGLIWQELKSLVVIKHKDKSSTAFIMPDEEIYLLQNLKLELTHARLALLRRDADTLNASLTQIDTWIRANFDPESSAVMHVLDTLGDMQGLDLTPELPDLQATLVLVREYIQSG